MKKSILVCCIILLITLITGCRGNDELQLAESKPTRIEFHTMWVDEDSKADIIQNFIDEFNLKQTEIHVDIVPYYNYEAYREQMRLLLLTGDLPDIFTVLSEDVDNFVNSDDLLDLSPYIKDSMKEVYFDGVFNLLTKDNQILGLPFEYGTVSVFYNKSLLSEVGINAENFPDNYEDFFLMCDNLTASGIVPLSQMTGENAWTSMLWYSAIVTSLGGKDVYDTEFEDPAFVEAARILKKMYGYTTTDAIGATAQVSGNHFLNSETAMLINGPWYIGKMQNFSDSFIDSVDIAPLPDFNHSQTIHRTSYLGFVQASILLKNQNDKNIESSMVEFITLLTEKENTVILSKASGSLFVRKLDNKDTESLSYLQRQIISQLNRVDFIAPHLYSSVNESVSNAFPELLTRLLLGLDSEEEFIRQLKAQLN